MTAARRRVKTAALLPTPGDPFLVRHWLRHCELWRDEVDELRVLVGGQDDREACDYIRAHVEELGGIYMERQTGGRVAHGDALGILVAETGAESVVLLEDDAYVRFGGEIAQHFDFLRGGSCDVVASPRVSMSENLESAAESRWPREPLADSSKGHGMWPAFVFAYREHLLDTDRRFAPEQWAQGLRVPGLRYTVPAGESAFTDTFGSMAFQLRDKRRVLDVPQWKGPRMWAAWLAGAVRMGWFHIGSLASAGNLGGHEPPGFQLGNQAENEVEEWAHRLGWWRRCLDLYGHELPGFADRYAKNWERLRGHLGVLLSAVNGWRPLDDRMVTWAE
jgi:hypothetical protein